MNKTNPLEYEWIAREIFAPIYPVIAEQILKETGIKWGKCVDIGTGPGFLGLAVAAISALKVCLLDISPEMIAYANQNIQERQMERQVYAIRGDVHRLPFPDQSTDLVISRGSIFFWDDLRKAMQEIYRVLAPGGTTFIGGGFGSNELKDQIEKKMAQKDERWAEKATNRMKSFATGNYEQVLHELKIPYKVKRESGFWIIIEKEA
jgi:ubiquinone/menaquinone biosynthesis C-methylase UbiE